MSYYNILTFKSSILLYCIVVQADYSVPLVRVYLCVWVCGCAVFDVFIAINLPIIYGYNCRVRLVEF